MRDSPQNAGASCFVGAIHKLSSINPPRPLRSGRKTHRTVPASLWKLTGAEIVSLLGVSVMRAAPKDPCSLYVNIAQVRGAKPLNDPETATSYPSKKGCVRIDPEGET